MIDVLANIIGPGVRLFPVYLITTILMAYAVYRAVQPSETLLRWLFPRKIWLHPSTMLDVKLFLVNRAFAVFGLFSSVSITSLVAICVLLALSGRPEAGTSANPILVSFLVLLANDFGVYWIHRMHHETRILWPFHAVHHSAEVMTPITVYRKHPIYDIFSSAMRSVLYGVLQGVVLAIFVGPMTFSTLFGVNVFYFLFNIFGANLRHSHVWFSYGRILEHIFISPAQHQIHHSRTVEHHNKNYGEVLAIWDWMFGTLYVPEKRENLDFGLADAKGRPVPQPHASLSQALAAPVQESFKIAGGRNKAVNGTAAR
jgi:sterol desaturase/sphingolipid hydroxylase (fatty acid hydroxylase superfamily)